MNDTNDTNKGSKLCEMLRFGADHGHYYEVPHSNADDVCYVGDGPGKTTDTGIETNTQRDDQIAQW